MIGQRLHDYDLDLCDYLIGNVAQYMASPWFALRVQETLTSLTLLNYLQARQNQAPDAEQIRLLLNDDELYRLELVFQENDLDRRWEPYEPLHRRFVDTLPEVRDGLSRQAAEDWSDACGQFAQRLESGRVRLSEGIGVIREWVGKLRTLLRVMGAVQFLPALEGLSPTPTHPTPTTPSNSVPANQAHHSDQTNLVSQSSSSTSASGSDGVSDRLERVEALLTSLVEREQVRDYYSIEEFASLVGKAEFTCREWCRLGRIKGEKKGSGRGKYQSWVVSHEELLRYRKEGLLPLKR